MGRKLKVAELEKEVLKEKELRAVYKKRMERTQDYLRYCLQVAQDNGFLDLIHNYNNNMGPQPGLLSPNILTPNASPRLPTTPLYQPSDLAVLIDQAHLNGWYIHPEEVLNCL